MESKLNFGVSKIKQDGLSKHSISAAKTIGKLYKHELRHFIYKLKWKKSFSDPYKLINVDPSSINYYLKRNRNFCRYGTYIRGGNWDQNYYQGNEHIWDSSQIPETREFSNPTQIKFKNYDMYESLKKHFCDGIAWEETEYYKRLVDAGPGPHPRTRSKNYFERLDKLYNSIKNNGYKSQKEILKDDSVHSNKTRIIKPELNEVAISIGRKGNLMHDGGGEHRLCIAKILELEKIPVRVIVRHTEWQMVRQKLFESEQYESTDLIHPDLKDIIT